jgi:hypothetical protein
VSQWLTERASSALARRTTRRGFLARSAIVGSAMTAAPLRYLLRPGSAYAAICGCHGQDCGCGDLCCDGYTQFCCTINDGLNTCPPGSFAGGWWKADGSVYCSGPRYYIDCVANCDCSSGCESSHFCVPACDGETCSCALGDCHNRHVSCTTFRYGQCHQEIACSGRIVCRVVSCTPAWLLDDSCSTSSATDDFTANHNADCPSVGHAPVVGAATTPDGLGYWLATADGRVFGFGSAAIHGSVAGRALNRPVVGMATTPDATGYWLVAADGGVFNFGSAGFHGSLAGRALNRPVVGMAATPDGKGYWLVAADGGVFNFGSAPFDGSAGGRALNRPVVGMAATPDGKGYWLVAAEGGVFAFGSAGFHGSLSGRALNRPVVGMAATPDGQGYWLVGSDGGVFNFGSAGFHGSVAGAPLSRTAVAVVPAPDGQGYWLVASDGGVFAFGRAAFHGGLASGAWKLV